MVKILQFLFPKTIAAIRSKAYNAGRGDLNEIIQELVIKLKETANESKDGNHSG